MELRLWREICQLVVLGTKHIFTVIASMKKNVVDPEQLEKFVEETNELSELHKTLRCNRFTYEAFLPHIHDLWPGAAPPSYTKPRQSKYTELRAAYCSTKWRKLRDCDRVSKPLKYLKYVRDTEEEDKMIRRYKDLLDTRDDKVAEQAWPNELINQRLEFCGGCKGGA